MVFDVSLMRDKLRAALGEGVRPKINIRGMFSLGFSPPLHARRGRLNVASRPPPDPPRREG
jgi:hypothetical protein